MRLQQLNVMCMALAKQAVEQVLQKSDSDPVAPTCPLLPLENCTVFIDEVKQISDPATRLRYSHEKQQAKIFLISEMCWLVQQSFKEVD